MSTIYHTPIDYNAIADDDTFNSPLSQLDSHLDDAMTFGVNNNAELAAARSPYASLDARLDSLIMAGGNVATKANGVSEAGQKVLTVDATDGFVVGAYVTYLLNGTALEGNTIGSIQAGVSLTLGTNIGTGGVLDDSYISMISTSEYLAAQAIPHAGTLMLPDTMAYANGGVFNVAAYGASPSASGTENAVAIQEAIDAASVAGGIVLLPEHGIYNIDTGLTISASNVIIQGAGLATILKCSAGSGNIITVAAGGSIYDVGIRDLYIRPNVSKALHGIYNTHCQQMRLTNAKVAYCDYGLYTDCYDTLVIGCIFLANNRGLYAYEIGNALKVYGGHFNANVVGIDLYTLSHAIIETIIEENTTAGIRLRGSCRSIHVNSYFENNTVSVKAESVNGLTVSGYINHRSKVASPIVLTIAERVSLHDLEVSDVPDGDIVSADATVLDVSYRNVTLDGAPYISPSGATSVQSQMDGLNLISNGNFQLWSSGTTSSPSSWFLSGSTITRVTDDPRHGDYVIELTNPGGANAIYQDITIPIGLRKAGLNITVVTDAKVVSGDNVRLQVQPLTAASAQAGTDGDVNTSSTTWKTLHTFATCASTVVKVRVSLRWTSTNASVGRFGGVAVFLGSTPWPFVPKVTGAHILHRDATTSVYSETGDVDLGTYTLPAGTLKIGDGIHIKAAGTIAGTTAQKDVALQINGITVGAITEAAGATDNWLIDAEVYFTNLQAMRIFLKTQTGATLGVPYATATLTGTDYISTTDLPITVHATLANGADTISQSLFVIELMQ